MSATNIESSSPFKHLDFLWHQHALQIMRADGADEMMEDKLGLLLYVDDYSVLSPDAKAHIDKETQNLNSRLFSLTLANNVIGQSLIIATDRIIKSVSQDVNASKKGPLVAERSSFLGAVKSPQVFWAYGVRCAANYVRHAGEWKSEATIFHTSQGKFPKIGDFQRNDTQSNLQVLSEILNCGVSALLAEDCTYAIAERLDLTKRDSLESLYTSWQKA